MIEFDLVKELFDYVDGNLYWRKKSNKRHSIDVPAGTIDVNGYRTITLNGKKYRAHRLIWLWHGKELPKIIDHIDGNKLNNRIENLREATTANNAWNSKIKSDNSSGVRNVSWCNTYQRWIVQIFKNNQKISARFKEFDDACKFANDKRKQLHGDFFSERTV